jgi:hypothetical protein
VKNYFNHDFSFWDNEKVGNTTGRYTFGGHYSSPTSKRTVGAD